MKDVPRASRRTPLLVRALAITAAAGVVAGAAVRAPAEAIVGVWQTADEHARVRIGSCGGGYCGWIVWVAPIEGVGVPLDVHNPDPKLRGRPIEGLKILREVHYAGDGVWRDGTVYDPEKGKEYSVRATLTGADTLTLRGFVAIPLLGRTVTWTRVPPGAPEPHPTPRPPDR